MDSKETHQQPTSTLTHDRRTVASEVYNAEKIA